MNIMILSPGRRVEVINYFKKALTKLEGEVITLDMSPYAAALYEGDKKFVLDKNFEELQTYMDNIIDICNKNNIKAIMTLIDPELTLLAKNTKRLLKQGIVPIISHEEEIEFCFDKYEFYMKLKNFISVVPTYSKYTQVIDAIKEEKLNFPLFVKPRYGSGSVGANIIYDFERLASYKESKDYVFQPFINKKEYGVDVYFDMIDGKIKSIFIKEKLTMRSGETDKAISVYKQDIIDLIMKLEVFNFKGPIDIDVFEDIEGNLYINEINPRFGGGYPHAYNAGVDFIEYILNNVQGQIVESQIGNYQTDLIMMKYSGTKFISKEEVVAKILEL